ncbi:MAG: hypothetical protein K0R28_6875, partial [Paenibacillus sp.]|nr:hypothetical protein [Paenibacillus sp.]
MRTKSKLIALTLMTSVLVSACSGQGSGTGAAGTTDKKAEEKPKEPYTMTIFTAGVSQEEFNKRFSATLKQKFPHVTIEYIVSGKGQTISDLVAANKIPDIIRTDVPTLQTGYLDYKIGYDLTEMVK